MPLTSKDEYLKKSRGLQTGFGSTIDFADKSVGTTSQSEGGVGASGEDLPGQVFSVDQLPDPEVARAFGMAPVTIPEHLILDTPGDAETHIQGKTAEDIATAKLRRELGDPILAFDNTVLPADEAKLSMTDRTGENAFGKADTDDTGSGRPIDTEGVQQPDSGGTESVPAADGGVQDSKGDGKGGTQASGAKQGGGEQAKAAKGGDKS